jgi:2-dehydro-3-deoxy-D-gluconate 5-dehydrogenase
MALALAEAGCAISGVNVVAPMETAENLKLDGHRFLDIRADLATIEPIPEIIQRTITEYGRIDILVNNAGIIRRADALEFSERDSDDVIAVNLRTVFFLSQAVARQFVAQGQGGRIVNVASMLSFQGGIRVPSYTASKSGVAGLTKLMANEWAEHGITVNALAPGWMDDQQHGAVASRSDPQQGDSRPHSGWSLGIAGGCWRPGCLSLLARRKLRHRSYPGCRRRVARALTVAPALTGISKKNSLISGP